MVGKADKDVAKRAAVDSRADAVGIAARAFERDRYLAALLAPRAARIGLLALVAFAGDVGRIPTTVTEPMMGAIRLQWWRDAIDAHAASAVSISTGHPIADALGSAMRRHRLTTALLHAVIDAVADRLDDRPFADRAALTANIGRLDGSLFRLALEMQGGEPDGHALVADAAQRYGLARILCELPAELAQGRVLLPADMLAAHGCSPDHARDAASTARWRELIGVLSAAERASWPMFAERYQRAPVEVRTAVLPVALVRPYLKASERVDIAALEVCDIGPLTRVWRLWLAHRLRSI